MWVFLMFLWANALSSLSPHPHPWRTPPTLCLHCHPIHIDEGHCQRFVYTVTPSTLMKDTANPLSTLSPHPHLWRTPPSSALPSCFLWIPFQYISQQAGIHLRRANMCLVWLSWSRILESEGSLCMGFRTDSAAVRNTTCELSSLNFNQCLHGCFKLYLVVSTVLLTYTTYCFDLPVVWHTPTPLSWIPAVGEPSVNDDNNGVIFYKMLQN